MRFRGFLGNMRVVRLFRVYRKHESCAVVPG